MALYKIEDFAPDYRDSFDGKDIKGHGVYAEGDEKVGTVSDILVDEEGRLRYFVVDLGFWIFGKKVLLPVGRSQIDYQADRVYAVGLSRQQAEDLPEFNENMTVDYDYEERVRGVYRTPAAGATGTRAAELPVERATPLEASAPLDNAYATSNQTRAYSRDTYNYQQEPSLYGLNEQNHQNLKLYEERLVANKRRVKTGEVAIGKHVETETQRISVPVEKERVVVERTTPTDAGRPVAPGEATFREGEVAHMEIYEESADVRKEAVVREEVNIRKEVERETVQAEETIRREELDIDAEGRVIDDRTDRTRRDRSI